MLKSFINITIALVLSFSIVGPSLVSYVCNDLDIIEIADFGEEEKKEVEKKEQKVLNTFQVSLQYSFITTLEENFFYTSSYLNITREIIIPPPDLA